MLEGQRIDDVKGFYKLVGGRAGVTEYYMYDATNIRLRELAVSYALPQRSSGFYPHAWPLCRYCGARRGHGAVRRKDEASDRRVVEIIRKVARVRSGDWETAGKYRI